MRSIEPIQDSDRGKHEKRRGEYKTITSRRKKYPLQFSVILIGSVIIVGIILLIFFFGSTNFIVFIGILLIPVYMGIYWIFHVLKEDRKYIKIALMAEFQRAETMKKREKILDENIKPLLEACGAINIRITTTYPPKMTFIFPKGDNLDFLEIANVISSNSNDVNLEAVIEGNYPFSLSIQPTSTSMDSESEIKDLFTFHSNHPSMMESILTNNDVQRCLNSLVVKLVSFSLNGKFLSTSFVGYETLSDIFELSTLIYNDVIIQDYGDLEVEELHCYQCGDVLRISEKECERCGSPRPTCIVCLLDLKPSEKMNVVRTPCCETYGHRDHLISWLEKNPTCSNCKKDLFLWIRSLKQEV